MGTINASGIPPELKDLDQWVNWKKLSRGDGKFEKKPYQPNGRGASTKDKTTWSTFDSVVSAYNDGGYDGIGFVFTKDDPYAGIDFDKCVDGDDLKEDIAVWVRRFGSYTELSPSATGVHIIVKTDLDFKECNLYVDRLENKVEYYPHNHYFTFTGNVLKGYETIKNSDFVMQELIEIVLEQEGKKSETVTTPPTVAQKSISTTRTYPQNKDPHEIYAKLVNFPEAQRVFTEFETGDKSAATLKFTNILVRNLWCGRDADLVESVVRLSPIFREKCDEKRGESTWLQYTIKDSIEKSIAFEAKEQAKKEAEKEAQLVEQAQQVFDPPVGVPKLWKLRNLNDAYAERPPTRYVVDKLFSIPSLNIVYGAPGTLKSMLLCEAAVCVASGQPWLSGLPTEDGSSVKAFRTIKAPVLWIDYDNGARRTDERFEALAKARGLPVDAPVHYVSMADPWLKATDGLIIAQLVNLIIDIKAKLVVIDNLGLISGDADENSADMTEVMGNLRKLAEWSGSAVVVIHHQRKGAMADRQGDLLRGHSSIEAALDLALLVTREKQDPKLVISPTKVRGASIAESFGAEFTYDHKQGTWDLEKAKFFGVPISSAKEIENKEIANAVLIALNRLINNGEVATQKALVAATQSYIETETDIKKPGVNRIRGVIDGMEQEGLLKVDGGSKTTKIYVQPQ